MIQTCYTCGAQGSTREHVPPLSFFPPGFRKDLWTVRACAEHNIANSKDVEYVRNLIVTNTASKNVARSLVHGVALRSFERSPALLSQTFLGKEVPATHEGTIACPVSLSRFERVMKAIAMGIYFKEMFIRFAAVWEVFIPSIMGTDMADGNDAHVQTFVSALPFQNVRTPHPSVFRYGRNCLEINIAYRFEFYEGFCVYVYERSLL